MANEKYKQFEEKLTQLMDATAQFRKGEDAVMRCDLIRKAAIKIAGYNKARDEWKAVKIENSALMRSGDRSIEDYHAVIESWDEKLGIAFGGVVSACHWMNNACRDVGHELFCPEQDSSAEEFTKFADGVARDGFDRDTEKIRDIAQALHFSRRGIYDAI